MSKQHDPAPDLRLVQFQFSSIEIELTPCYDLSLTGEGGGVGMSRLTSDTAYPH